ncbi:MAG TPA: cytochrome c [Candidatus Acidoferrales bacterium]
MPRLLPSAALALLIIPAAMHHRAATPTRSSTSLPESRAALSQKAEAAPTFYRDVLPILQQHCQSCHRPGEIGPMPLITFDQARSHAAAIADAVEKKKMPPWFAEPGVGRFLNDPSLTPREISIIAAWAEADAPAGNPDAAPPRRSWKNGWNIPEPDEVIEMPRPVTIPARGMVDYTYEIVPTNFKEGEWVRMSEVRPSSRANVHHAVVYVRPPGAKWLRRAPIGVPFTAGDLPDEASRRDANWTDAEILLVYAPGSLPDRWPEGMAKFVPAGSDLVFQMHYITNGRAASDRTKIGMVFSKQPPQERVLTLQLTNDHFVIPPGADDYRVEAHGTLPNDATLLSFLPHMHLRGKSFEYNIVRPDGSISPLLRVNWNFYWQLSYRLAEPLPLKAGTELQAVAYYDNSRNNPHNPDPDVAVRWGDQTTDEMMVGFFDVAVPAEMDKWKYFIRKKAAAAK